MGKLLTTVSFINGYWQLLVGPTRKQVFKHKSKKVCEHKRCELIERSDTIYRLSVEDIDTLLIDLKRFYRKLYKLKIISAK